MAGDGKVGKASSIIRPFDRFRGQVEKAWLPEQLMWRTEISANAKLVYARLSRYQGKGGEAYPKLDTLAVQTGLSKSATQRALAELVLYELVESKVRRGQHRPNRIRFLDHPWFDEKPPAEASEEAPNGAPNGMSGDVPSNPPANHAQPASGSWKSGSNPPANHAQPTSESLLAPATHQRFSGEGSHYYEGSHLKGLTVARPSDSRTHVEAEREALGGGSGRPPPLNGEAGDSGKIKENQSSAPPADTGGLSMENDVNSWENIQRLQQVAAQSLAKTQKQHTENQQKAAAKAKKSKVQRGTAEQKRYVSVKPFEDLWREELKKKFPDLSMETIARWFEVETVEREGNSVQVYKGQKEVGQVRHLIKRFSPALVEQYLRWSIQNWDKLRERFKKSPKVPNVGWLCSLASALMPEATMNAVSHDVQAEADQWFKDHPNATNLPPELLARLQAALMTGG